MMYLFELSPRNIGIAALSLSLLWLEACVAPPPTIPNGKEERATPSDTYPVDNSNSTKPVENSKGTMPAENSNRTKPVENSRGTKPAENSNRTKPVENSRGTKPAENSNRTKPVENSRGTKPAENSNRAKPVENSRGTMPAENSNTTKPTEFTNSANPAAVVRIAAPKMSPGPVKPIQIKSQNDACLTPSVYDFIASHPAASVEQKNAMLSQLRSALDEKPQIGALREKRIKDLVVQNCNIPGFFEALKQRVEGDYSLPHNLEHEVTAVANFLSREENANITMDVGRKSLINEMVKFPGQLDLDLNRGVLDMRIGTIRLHKSIAKLSRTEQFSEVSRLLEEHVNRKKTGKPYTTANGKLGEFWLSEIIFSLVQNFQAEVYNRAVQEVSLITDGEWGVSKIGAKRLIDYSIRKWTPKNILVLSYLTANNLVRLNNPKIAKKFKMVTKISFDLDAGNVTYRFKYEIEGTAKRSWTSQAIY